MALAYIHLLCIKKTLLLRIPLLHHGLEHKLCQSAISTSPASHTNIFQSHGSQTHVSGFGMSGKANRLNNLRRLKEALQPLHFMEDTDSSTYASLLQGCLNNKALSEGKLVHAHIIQIGFVPSVLVQTNLVTMYAKCGSLKDGRRALQEMGKQNVVSWTAMIVAYSRHGSSKEALRLFHQMQQGGIQPNQFTFASILPACVDLASLKHGKEMHRQIIASGIQSNIFVAIVVLDMYI
jgi:pentatricopeptide repeat protein